MKLGGVGTARRELRSLFEGGATAGLTDGQLLARFSSGRGDAPAEAAFAALVARHGPMVWGTCRRILRDSHAAEDAFQATFLVLVKKAGSVRVDDSLGRWLHGVGVRVALRAKASGGRRAAGDLAKVEPSAPTPDPGLADLRAAIDEEVDRLPSAYRSVVVLCHLEGLTRERAAGRLGCPVGTVNSRLSRAGELLKERLTRRGLAPASGALMAWLVAPEASAAVPPKLVGATVTLATRFAVGVAKTGMVPAVALAEGVLKGMGMSLLKKVGIVGAGALAVGAGVMAQDRAVPARAGLGAPVEARAPRIGPITPPGDSAIFRGGPARIGFIPDLKAIDHPIGLWTTLLDGVPGEPVVVSGVVFVGDSRFDRPAIAQLYAIRADDGTILWRHADEGDPVVSQIMAAPLVVGDKLFYTSTSGLTALSKADGTRLWHLPIAPSNGACESSPLLVAGRILFAACDGKIHAVDPATGRTSWTSDLLAGAPSSSPGRDDKQARMRDDVARPTGAASDGSTLFQSIFDQGRLVAVDARTGEPRWSFATRGWMHPGPMIVGSSVIVGTQDGGLYCLDKSTGRQLWRFAATNTMIQSGAGSDGESIYFGSCDGRFRRLNSNTGREIWSFQTKTDARLKERGKEDGLGGIYSSPLLGDDLLYFGSQDGYLYALDRDGHLQWRHRAIEGSEIATTPCTDGRRLFVSVSRRSKDEGRNAISAIGESPVTPR